MHYCCTYLPIADIGDRSEGVTVTVIGLTDVPPIVLTTTCTNPDDSKPVKYAEANSTIKPNNKMSHIVHFTL